MKYSDIPKQPTLPEPQFFNQVCKYCHQPIYGGKGDYWHADTLMMQCKGSMKLAYPAAWMWVSTTS